MASPAGSEGFSVSQAELERLPLSIALFEDVIQPMLRAECGECHLGEPLMGGLSVASHADLIQSGTLLPGEPDQSELLRRVLLPASDDDRMPPEGMQPLDAAETFALRYWIEQGAMAPDPRARSSLPAGVARAAIARLTPASVPGSTPGPVVRTEAAAERAARADGGGCAACSGTRSKAASMPAIGVLAVGGGLWGRRRTRLLRVQQGRRAT